MRTRALSSIVALSFIVLSACEANKDPMTAAKDATTKAADATKEAVKDAADATADAVKDAASATKDAMGDAADAVGKKASDLAGTNAPEMMQKALDGVKTQVATLKEKAKSAPASVKPMVDQLMPAIDSQIKTIESKMSGLKEMSGDALGKAINETRPLMDKLNAMVKEVATKLGA